MEPTRPYRFPTSSKSEHEMNPRVQAAGVRAIESYARLTRIAESLSEEIGETTSPHGIPVTDLSDEDSMVIAVKNATGKTGRASTVDDE